MHISFVHMVKFQFLEQFPVDHYYYCYNAYFVPFTSLVVGEISLESK